ncbi:MAG TPA: flagellar hook capping FlgD N-terminal domain-containing protein [Baekduia sp.]|uniref:flagellar hook capping FlgD N-terminal domain-containing protein n=1 Tax=Baekduia sp. TaxID=2600305 RepID=UPI002D78152B|nr:flagellar hook capping FlgD N-terminal domain-containing protein [Baekduia sp.]HET6508865.1 flagellar hook capping FlgD N-terminal domain-containing protein [Baekduia sp.]
MSSASAIGNMYTNPAYNQSQTGPSDTLDKNGFLKMLTAQLSNQDPNSGQDPNQYFQTISMMTQVEQITNMVIAQSKSNATQMIGKDVTFVEGNTAYSGTVDSVQMSGSTVRLTVGGMTGVDPDTVVSVRPHSDTTGTGTGTDPTTGGTGDTGTGTDASGTDASGTTTP